MSKKLFILRRELKEDLKKIAGLADSATTISESIIASHPEFDTTKDARVLYFLFMREGIQCYLLSESLSKKLTLRKWYENNGLSKAFTDDEPANKKFMGDRFFHFGQWTKSAFFMQTFIDTENTIRLIAESYDGGSCNAYGISKIVEKLIDKLGLDVEFKTLWKVIAYIRNTAHNGSFHKDKDGEDSTISYKGKDFEFKHKHPIDFLSIDNLLFLMLELMEFMKAISVHDEISSIGSIVHNFAEVEFIYEEPEED